MLNVVRRIIVILKTRSRKGNRGWFYHQDQCMHKYEIQGSATITRWYGKYGNCDDYSLESSFFKKTPEQIHNQTQKLKSAEKQKQLPVKSSN